MSGKKKKLPGHQVFRCPICGAAYRHKGMAMRCVKTIHCKTYNAPGHDIRRLWSIQGGAAYLAAFLCYPIVDNTEDLEILNAASKVKHQVHLIFNHLRKTLPVAEHVSMECHSNVMAKVGKYWPPNKVASIWAIAEVTLNVVSTAEFELKQFREFWGSELSARLLSDLYDRIEDLWNVINPDNLETEQADLLPEITQELEDAIIGPRPQERRPSLYLVNERHLVVGRGRADVRKVMMEFGLSRPRIEGICQGEKFEDGRTAEDIIKTAVRVPALIGRMEG